MTLPIALQLWSVKDEVEKDFFMTLEKIAEMGYDGVEFAGYYGKTATEVKAKLAELNLKIAGSHIGIEQLTDNIDQVIAFEKELGNKYVICPYAAFETVAEWEKLAEKLQTVHEKLAVAGLTLVYHNHDKEFMPVGDEFVMDMILKVVPKAEIDVYWVEFAGVNPTEYLQKYAGRTPLIHVKDMAPSRQESIEVGNGILNIAEIVKQAEENRAEWLVVEQEAFTKPPLESVEICLNNLKKIIGR